MSPALAGRFFTTEPPGKPMLYEEWPKNKKIKKFFSKWLQRDGNEIKELLRGRICMDLVVSEIWWEEQGQGLPYLI